MRLATIPTNDQFGKPISQVVRRNSITQMNYDSAGRPLCTTLRMTLAGTQSASACAQSGGTPRDRITRTYYDLYDSIVEIQRGYGTELVQSTRRMDLLRYWRIGKPCLMQTATKTYYTYDGFGRLDKAYYPHKNCGGFRIPHRDYEDFGYDKRSAVTSRRTRSGQSFVQSYDNLGRLTYINAPGSDPDVTYSYDQAGRRITASQSGHVPDP